jgi:hypothetical protein
MKQRITYVIAVILLVCANAVQLKANGHIANAKKRIAQLTANLPSTADRMDLIRNDDIRNDQIQKAHAWAKPGYACAGLGTIAMIAAMVRKEKGWHSITILLWIFYGALITTS